MSDTEHAPVPITGTGWHGFVRRFWSGEDGITTALLGVVLFPLELAYRAVIGVRNFAYDRGWARAERAGVKIVSVGNLTVGGTGKTPFTRWLVDNLLERGRRPAVLHGGYGEDEPTLHRRWHPEIPVEAGRDRLAGAHAAQQKGADIAILDDGFQHRRLHRDLDLVLISAEDWSARIRLLPRGPWRESLSSLNRAHGIVVTRRTASSEQASAVAAELRRLRPEVPVIIAAIEPLAWSRNGESSAPPQGPVVAVAAIAQPERFAQNVAGTGTVVETLLAYPDHHTFTRSDIAEILQRAAGRPVVTTAKDAVKLSDLIAETDVWILEQSVEIETGAAELERLLGSLTS